MRLRELRKQKQLNQSEISKYLNVALSTYGGYEQGTSEPNIETLCKLADYYNVTLDYLVGHENENDFGYLDELDINILKISKQLNTHNKMQALAYMSGLFTGQQ